MYIKITLNQFYTLFTLLKSLILVVSHFTNCLLSKWDTASGHFYRKQCFGESQSTCCHKKNNFSKVDQIYFVWNRPTLSSLLELLAWDLYKGDYYMSSGTLHKTVFGKHSMLANDCILFSITFYTEGCLLRLGNSD